jgi:hypothetical protein
MLQRRRLDEGVALVEEVASGYRCQLARCDPAQVELTAHLTSMLAMCDSTLERLLESRAVLERAQSLIDRQR